MAELENEETMMKLEELLMDSVQPGKTPSRKDMLALLDNPELNEELKEGLKSLLNMGAPQVFGSYGSGTYLGITFVIIIFSILIFFGYKLYKSIKEKEIKREEKKKLKQMKKKK